VIDASVDNFINIAVVVTVWPLVDCYQQLHQAARELAVEQTSVVQHVNAAVIYELSGASSSSHRYIYAYSLQQSSLCHRRGIMLMMCGKGKRCIHLI